MITQFKFESPAVEGRHPLDDLIFTLGGRFFLLPTSSMFAKIFDQIYDSSIADNWKTRVVFQDMLVLCDSDGVIDKTAEAIARRTRLPLRMVKDAIAELEAPDVRSRCHEKEGRRLIRIDPHRDWGWHIVNYERYRNTHDEFDRKSYMRRYMREHYKPKKANKKASKNGILNGQFKESLSQSKTLDDIPSPSSSPSPSKSVAVQEHNVQSGAAEIYALYPRKVGRPKAIAAILKALKGESFEVLRVATENYARAWKDAPAGDMQFCPHPATWFNQERYLDDPSTWARSAPMVNGKPQPAKIDYSNGF